MCATGHWHCWSPCRGVYSPRDPPKYQDGKANRQHASRGAAQVPGPGATAGDSHVTPSSAYVTHDSPLIEVWRGSSSNRPGQCPVPDHRVADRQQGRPQEDADDAKGERPAEDSQQHEDKGEIAAAADEIGFDN